MPRYDFAAGMIIYRLNDRGLRTYLVVKSSSGYWELSKGHPRSNENWLETATRELQEETGITQLRYVHGFARQIRYVYRDRQLGITLKTVHFAIAETKSDTVCLSHEHVQFAFLLIEEAVHRLDHANIRAVVRDADAFLDKNQPLPETGNSGISI